MGEMTDEQFYEECASLLGTTHEGQPFPFYKRTRWNNRTAGRGRFPGRGIIRVFGDVVHVSLNNPALHMVGSKEEVLAALRA